MLSPPYPCGDGHTLPLLRTLFHSFSRLSQDHSLSPTPSTGCALPRMHVCSGLCLSEPRGGGGGAQGLTHSECSKQNTYAGGGFPQRAGEAVWTNPGPTRGNTQDQWCPALHLEARLPPPRQQGSCALAAEASQLSEAMSHCFKLTN